MVELSRRETSRSSSKMPLRRSARHSASLVASTSNGAVRKSPVISAKRSRTETEPEPIKSKKAKATNPAMPSEGSRVDKFKHPPLPATPNSKRTARSKKVPPLTPTPSLVGLLRAPYSSGDIDDTALPPNPPLDRLVDPHVTNATLVTPGGTQVVAYPNGIPDSS